MTTIALIGFGAFGRLAAQHIAPHAPLLIHDPRADPGEIRRLGEPVSLERAAISPWVVLATPVQALPEVLAAIAPRIAPNAVVADVGSVKTLPARWMLEQLPPHAGVLGTHPLFGPQTAADRGGIAGEPIALCRARLNDENYERARSFLADTLALRVLEMTPDEHDRQAALVQGITHLIGHAAREMDLPDLEMGTLAYRRLLQMKRNTEHDSAELFEAIQRLNPHAAAARRTFLDALLAAMRRAQETG